MRTLAETLEHINESLATIRRCRPGWARGYTMDPCLTEEELLAFEQAHRCTLPGEYREFLRVVGESGRGPGDALFSPRQHFPDSGFKYCFKENVDLSLPFPYTEAWTATPDPDRDFDGDYFSERHVCGSLILSEGAGTLLWRLIITGPLAGEIWEDDRGDSGGLCPALTPDGRRWTFLPWYLESLEQDFKQWGHPGARAQSRTRSWRS